MCLSHKNIVCTWKRVRIKHAVGFLVSMPAFQKIRRWNLGRNLLENRVLPHHGVGVRITLGTGA